jgi:hypothetical protein
MYFIYSLELMVEIKGHAVNYSSLGCIKLVNSKIVLSTFYDEVLRCVLPVYCNFSSCENIFITISSNIYLFSRTKLSSYWGVAIHNLPYDSPLIIL